MRDHARALVLAGSMSVEPAPALLELRVPAIRRTVQNIAPPLDLTALVFRYRVTADGIEPVNPVHSSSCRRRRSR
ncbi:MAG: hypothetical protein JOZ54_19725 [Acidobacteria bacterium]|nr:hypothetical protein [Acidobacteriota bacterium]